MKATSLMYHKGGYIKASPDELHIPFRAMKGKRRSMSTRRGIDDARSWVLELLSHLAWKG